ncbi:MAG: hypothetical protein ACRCY8_10005, partial [Dermatophilaceae bacterium]
MGLPGDAGPRPRPHPDDDLNRHPPEVPAGRHPSIRHPVVAHEIERRTGDVQLRVADAITRFAGSMTFVYA